MSRELSDLICDGENEPAVKLLDQESVQKSINQPFESKDCPGLYSTCLYRACEHGNTEVVEAILNVEGTDVNYEADRHKDTPLHVASQGGYKTVVQCLLGAGANISKTSTGSTPFQRAAANSHHEVLGLLLEYDTRYINEPVRSDTPLHWAAREGSLECIQILVKYGADTTITNEKGQTAKNVAFSKRHTDVYEFLTDAEDAKSYELSAEASCRADHTEMRETLEKMEGFQFNQSYYNQDIDDKLDKYENFKTQQEAFNHEVNDKLDQLREYHRHQRSMNQTTEKRLQDLDAFQNQQKTLNQSVETRLGAVEASANNRSEATHELQEQVKSLTKRVGELEKSSRKSMNSSMKVNSNDQASWMNKRIRQNFPLLHENIVASDHIDYLFSKEALILEDVQTIRSKHGDLGQTREMLYTLLGKKDPHWVYAFHDSLKRVKITRHLLKIFD